MTIDEIFAKQQLLPIIQADTVEDGLAVTKAMQDAGLTVVEVVLRNAVALELAKEIKNTYPTLSLGVGTIYNTKLLDSAINAGADFIVTPATTPTLTEALVNCGKPILPGVSTLSDIARLLEHGVDRMKLFPAEIVGGVKMLKAISALFNDIKFCPTGGVSPSNQADYLALDNVFAVGGTWMVSKENVAAKNWQAITEACKQAQTA